jgi:hypothetical protein
MSFFGLKWKLDRSGSRLHAFLRKKHTPELRCVGLREPLGVAAACRWNGRRTAEGCWSWSWRLHTGRFKARTQRTRGFVEQLGWEGGTEAEFASEEGAEENVCWTKQGWSNKRPEKTCIMRRSIICKVQQILLQLQNKGGWDWRYV